MSSPGTGGNGNFQLWKGLERSGKPAAHGRVTTALGRALAPTARNSDYPTAPRHWSDPGNVQEAHMDPDLAQDPGPRWFLLLWSSNPCFFSISGVDKSRSVCALQAPLPAPQHQRMGAGKHNQQQHKAHFGVNLGLSFVCCGSLSCKASLVWLYCMNH